MVVVEEEAVFTRESITHEDPPSAQQALHREGDGGGGGRCDGRDWRKAAGAKLDVVRLV